MSFWICFRVVMSLSFSLADDVEAEVDAALSSFLAYEDRIEPAVCSPYDEVADVLEAGLSYGLVGVGLGGVGLGGGNFKLAIHFNLLGYN
jgi:hypothetical protein